jgi:hypothetical protein
MSDGDDAEQDMGPMGIGLSFGEEKGTGVKSQFDPRPLLLSEYE